MKCYLVSTHMLEQVSQLQRQMYLCVRDKSPIFFHMDQSLVSEFEVSSKYYNASF